MQTQYPRIDPSIPAWAQFHFNTIYRKLNNHGLAFQQLVNTTPSLAAKAPSAGGSLSPAPAPALAALGPQQRAELAALLPLAQSVVKRPYREVTTAYTIDPATDFQINCTSGSFMVTLPSAAGLTSQIFSVKNSGTGTTTLAAVSGQKIDGSIAKALTQWDNIAVMSTGKGWIIVSIGNSM